MPTPDVAAIIAALPPIAFRPAEEAAVSSDGWCLVAPGGDTDWAIAYRLEGGWFGFDGVRLYPVLFAALPPAPFRRQRSIERLTEALSDQIVARRFDRAATLIDELADAVRAVRDRRP